MECGLMAGALLKFVELAPLLWTEQDREPSPEAQQRRCYFDPTKMRGTPLSPPAGAASAPHDIQPLASSSQRLIGSMEDKSCSKIAYQSVFHHAALQVPEHRNF